MKAVIIYESMFGNTQDVAEAISAGLSGAGVEVHTLEVGTAPTTIGPDVGLLVVGCPNHAFSMPRASTRQSARQQAAEPLVSDGMGVREWLGRAELPGGLPAVAYDTRSSGPKAVVAMDHASGSIEKALKKLGAVRLTAPEHFRVHDVQGPLEPGERDRARAWGAVLAASLVH